MTEHREVAIRTAGFALALAAMLAGLLAASGWALSGEGPAEDRRASVGPRFAFKDVTRRAGLSVRATPTYGSVFSDGDRNGWLDLLVVRHKREAFLHLNSSRGFEPLTTSAFSPPPDRWYYDRHSCAWGESNGDGRPDLMCVSGAQKGSGTGPNTLYRGPRLVDSATSAGVQDLYGRGRSVNWLDLDSDGDLDLFIGNQIRHGAPNLTLENVGGRFVPVDIGLTEERATNDSAWADWDNDGDPDLVVLGQGLRGSSAYENRDGSFVEIQMEGVTGQPWRTGVWGDLDADGWIDLSLVDDNRSVVLRNDRGRLRSVGMSPLDAGRASAWFDVENDGDLDLFIVQGVHPDAPRPKNLPDLLLVNRRGRFVVMDAGAGGPARGDGDAVSVGDYDRDGRADLFVTNGGGEDRRARPYLWRNLSRAENSVMLRLDGGKRNPFGFGAVVEVAAGSRSWTHQVTDRTGGHVQSSAGATIVGVGDARRLRVSVRWPDGSTDCVTAAAGDTVVMPRGSSPCNP